MGPSCVSFSLEALLSSVLKLRISRVKRASLNHSRSEIYAAYAFS
jgi:hypothetical protein